MAAPMNEPVITCPNCKTEVKLTEWFAAPLRPIAKNSFKIVTYGVDNSIMRG